MYDIIFAGDTFLRARNGNIPFTSSVENLFSVTDNVCVNLETTIGFGGSKVAKAYNFQSSPKALSHLNGNYVAICSLANNHSLDYGEEGLRESMANLQKRGISYLGTEVCNLKEITVENRKVRICSYYGNQKGLARINRKKIETDIKYHKQLADIVVICLHWGEEYVAYPEPKQQRFARALINAGANVVLGHHPHVMQGYEEYNGGVIFYSLGNFNFFVDHPYAKRLIETTKAYCVGLTIDKAGRVNYEIIPININEDWQPELIEQEEEKRLFFSYLFKISKPLKKGISYVFFLSEASPHYFHNHIPSWNKRIKHFGNSHRLQMLKWLIHPATYKYYIGWVLSLFHKTVRYQ